MGIVTQVLQSTVGGKGARRALCLVGVAPRRPRQDTHMYMHMYIYAHVLMHMQRT